MRLDPHLPYPSPFREHRAIGKGVRPSRGLSHELFLSLPAGGGFGLPTLFFLLELAGVTFDRTGRRLGLGKGWTGRVYVWLLTMTPAYAVFHRAVLDRVMFPWLERLGVT